MSDNASDNLQPWLIRLVSAVIGLALLSVCLRLLSRYERKQALWWDDYMIIFSMAWAFVVTAFGALLIHAGVGRHVTDVGMDGAILAAKYLLVAEVLYVYNMAWTKLSLLLMYYRIFHFPHFKRWAYIIGVVVIIWTITVTFLFIFTCVPVQKLWNPQLPGHCISQVGTWIANAVASIATDIAILVLPVPQIWKLQLGKVEKFALTFTFSLGFFVVFASIYRSTVLFEYDPKDPTYTITPTQGWTAIEMSAGITSACLPTMRPALKLLLRSLGLNRLTASWGSSGGSKGATNVSYGTRTADGGRSSHHMRNDSAFTRLEDGTSSEQTDWDLRPDKSSAMVTRVMGSSGKEESLDGDEVPLRTIRVQTEFKQTEC